MSEEEYATTREGKFHADGEIHGEKSRNQILGIGGSDFQRTGR